ncbi:uncharacterized protein LOC144063870 [Vanacampus margaritifer]
MIVREDAAPTQLFSPELAYIKHKSSSSGPCTSPQEAPDAECVCVSTSRSHQFRHKENILHSKPLQNDWTRMNTMCPLENAEAGGQEGECFCLPESIHPSIHPSMACTCTGATFSWVLHKGAMALLGSD